MRKIIPFIICFMLVAQPLFAGRATLQSGTGEELGTTANPVIVEVVSGGALWEIDGTETQLITADEVDMQSKKIINVTDPTANQEAATKKYVDDNVGSGDLLADGSIPLTADWNVGLFDITAVLFNGALIGNADTVTNATLTTALTVNTGTLTLIADAGNDSVLTIGGGAVSVSGANTGDNTVATSGDAAVDFFGAGVDAVTDATTCTDIEGTGLSITTGVLNAEVQTSDLHNAVTIGTANGLSLSTQALSMAVADTDTIGALNDTDWDTFNGKQGALVNSAGLLNALNDETGTGLAVFGTAPTFETSITGNYLTASEMVITDAAKGIVSAPVATYPSLTELSYVKGLTSAIQTQMDLKVEGDGTINPTNLLANGDFESWSAGTAVAPDGWVLTGASATVARSASQKIGTYSCALTRVGTNCNIANTLTTYNTTLKSRKVTFSCWVYATVASRARIRISDGVGAEYSSYHTGGSSWELLSITRTMDVSTAEVAGLCWVDTGDTTAYFDGAMLVEGASAFAFSPKPAEEGIWADYGAVSTVVGWSSYGTKNIYIKKMGDMVFCQFQIDGVSNNATTTFTVPYKPSHSTLIPGVATTDNGAAVAGGGLISCVASNATVTITKDMVSGAFTASGNKYLRGQFFYEAE